MLIILYGSGISLPLKISHYLRYHLCLDIINGNGITFSCCDNAALKHIVKGEVELFFTYSEVVA